MELTKLQSQDIPIGAVILAVPTRHRCRRSCDRAKVKTLVASLQRQQQAQEKMAILLLAARRALVRAEAESARRPHPFSELPCGLGTQGSRRLILKTAAAMSTLVGPGPNYHISHHISDGFGRGSWVASLLAAVLQGLLRVPRRHRWCCDFESIKAKSIDFAHSLVTPWLDNKRI